VKLKVYLLETMLHSLDAVVWGNFNANQLITSSSIVQKINFNKEGINGFW
jgi:hypothetical protein